MTRMSKRTISALLGAVMLTGAAGAASAHMVGGGPGPGGHFGGHFGGHAGGHFGHHRGFRGPYFIGYDDGYYGDSYATGDGCRYLRFKAHETGRPYWWRRYHACLDG